MRTILALGVVVTLVTNAGILAVFTDRATTGDNSATSGEFNGGGGGGGRNGPSGLEIAEATLDPDAGTVLCGDFVDDLATGPFAMLDVQPGTEETAYACLRNEASAPLSILTSAIDLVDAETACSPGEAEAGDLSCGADAGELSPVLVVALSVVDCGSRSPVASVETSLADLAGPSRSFGDPLDPAATECVQLTTSYPLETDVVLAQVAQTDEASWRIAFDATEVAGPPADWVLMWGEWGSGDGQFRYPQGIAVDSGGNVFVSDNENHRIQEFTADGQFLTSIGGFGYDPGQFRWPAGLAFDPAGNLYVADASNDRIQVFGPDGGFLRTWGARGSGEGELWYPYDVALDPSGHVYVVDALNHRIQVFDATGSFLRGWGSRGSGDGQFEYPGGIAVDAAGFVYVADTANDRIQKFDANGQFIGVIASAGNGEGEVNAPGQLRFDSSGRLVVPDKDNNRVQWLTSAGQFVRSVGASGVGPGQLSGPISVALHGGRLYVADTFNHRVQAFALQ
jgi:DNA-binding beta-propeller fold protein YncE